MWTAPASATIQLYVIVNNDAVVNHVKLGSTGDFS